MKVLVLEIGSLHLGYLGCYGNDWIDTPHFDRLAAEGVVFDRHYADTQGSRTGCYHCSQPGDAEDQALPAAPMLDHLLSQHEIAVQHVNLTSLATEKLRLDKQLKKALAELATSAPQGRLLWLALPQLAPPWQVADEYLHRYFGKDEPEDREDDETEYEDDEEVEVTEDEAAVEEPPPEPWLDPPVGPLELDDAAWERLQNTFAAVVTELDAQLGALLDHLDETGLADEVLVLVTAERGLPLGEHGVLGECRPWLHEELIHLPLLLRFPDGREAGRRVAALTQPVDLPPTLLDLFGIPMSEGLHGHSLLPLVRGEAEKVRDYACTGLAHAGRIEWALRTPEWAFLLPVQQAADDAPRGPQLFVKPDDRWEVNNLLQHNLELAEQFERTLHAFMVACRRPGPWMPPPLLLEAPDPVTSD
jgi:arylsulfatase A-like enzyme